MVEQESSLFVSCAQGLEPLLVEELAELGITSAPRFRGVGVSDSSFETIYRINYCSRLASRVLLPLLQFKCYNDNSLYRSASSIDWIKYIPRGKTLAIDANVQHREIRNSLYAAQVVKDAICDQFREVYGERPSVDVANPDVQLNLFIYEQQAVISFDTSRVPLHKRGYRQESVEAPLQESLAAALLRIAKYQGDEVLYDPCCGSGTLLVEAALIATRTAPGYLRQRWGFATLPGFSQQEWLRIKNEVDQKRIPLMKDRFFGTDVGKNAIYACKINLRAAGFHQSIQVDQCDFRDYIPRVSPNFLITNPPHGKRLGSVEPLRPLYRALGDWMRTHLAKPSRGFVFVGNIDLSKEIGLASTQRHVLYSGGVECRFLEFDIYQSNSDDLEK